MQYVGGLRAVMAGQHGTLRAAMLVGCALDLLTALVVVGYGSAYLVRTLQAPDSYPAFAVGVYGGVKLLAAPFGGWLADNTAGAQAALLTVALQAGGLALMLAGGNAEAYIAGIAPLSMGATLGWLLVFRAIGARIDADARGLATAYMTLVSGAGIAVGFGLAAALAELAPARAAFAVGLAVVVAYMLPLIRLHAAAVAPREERRLVRPRFTGRAEALAWLLALTHFGSISAAVGVFGPLVLDRLGLTLAQAALATSPALLAAAYALISTGRRSRQGRRLRQAAPLYGLGALGMLGMAAAGNVWVYALTTIPVGWALGGTSPLLSAARVDVSRAGGAPGGVLGRLTLAEGLGAGGGPLLVGLMIEAIGLRGGIVAVAAAFALSAGVAAVAGRLVRL